eukprot:TRINITY_DN12646_c0_g1_i1.p2 TRINITY_DN12646_c0_g1~~TRINITY_DN12646_c0_g1_i1.p2  ORF type:complete len:118 (-),score=10.19 TRINITY_DN12646_c0_g1_i1:490-843(-)
MQPARRQRTSSGRDSARDAAAIGMLPFVRYALNAGIRGAAPKADNIGLLDVVRSMLTPEGRPSSPDAAARYQPPPRGRSFVRRARIDEGEMVIDHPSARSARRRQCIRTTRTRLTGR